MLEKIVVVAGDILLPELGLSDDDKSRIIDEVSVVFYGSALLKMDALLEHSIDANVLSVIRAIELAQKMKKLIVSYLCMVSFLVRGVQVCSIYFV